jgi:hypothetical protein
MVVRCAQIMPYSTSCNMWLAERVNAHPEGQPPSKRRCERMTGSNLSNDAARQPLLHLRYAQGTHSPHLGVPGTASRSLSYRLPYRSSVMVAVLCPIRACTALMDAPALRIARDAHVCLSSCGTSPGAPTFTAAGSNTLRSSCDRMTPSEPGKTSLSAARDPMRSLSSFSTVAGTGTERVSCVLVGSTT